MSQEPRGVELGTSLGYLLKEASSALRASMEAVLRPLGMTVTHYSCLELLAQRPGLSNSDLARGTFVSRQSMNVLLLALERDGFVTRPDKAPVGKALPTQLTALGRSRLASASAAVRAVEERMLGALDDASRLEARRILSGFVTSLTSGDT
ncbi:MarR family winged helix-turn-helix transcriptional regulator [Subtercola lobariae]|uniref:MarR family transcriptional regulator n=1 Tax=Subtercola lobariae TaxID=1588641 RepID=A0A917EZ91_9MICO|nr:MarR family transcriptional regulator [Subtercola lobariae]GGF33018.1 MarR family transcriptional regulator [Subtercola lobariae]